MALQIYLSLEPKQIQNPAWKSTNATKKFQGMIRVSLKYYIFSFRSYEPLNSKNIFFRGGKSAISGEIQEVSSNK